jgi:hypothetical protein
MKDIDKGIFNSLRKLKNISLEVGVFADAKNTDDTPASYIADYALANEFGTNNIPARSFIRSTTDEQSHKWQKAMDDALSSLIEGRDANLDNKLYEVGQIVRGDIIQKIDSNISPVNALSTQKKKLKQGKNKTLIDTGALRQSIEARLKNV